MRKVRYFLPLIALLFLIQSGCKKKGPPPILWRASVNGVQISGTSVSAEYASLSTHLTISLFPSDSTTYPDILFTGRTIGNSVIDTGTYILNGSTPNLFTAEYDSSSSIIYYTPDGGSGQLYLSKFDTTAKLVSGTFYFTAHNASNPMLDSVVVTSGSFTNLSLAIQ